MRLGDESGPVKIFVEDGAAGWELPRPPQRDAAQWLNVTPEADFVYRSPIAARACQTAVNWRPAATKNQTFAVYKEGDSPVLSYAAQEKKSNDGS